MTEAIAGTDVRLGTPAATGLLTATILGSGVAFLDSTVVNVALPTIGRQLDASFAQLQWVVSGYTLTLAGFILIAGSLGDHIGRKRVYLIGIAGFATTSVLCALAPTAGFLVGARILQGVAGALLTPGSLAVIQASFRHEDRGRAIGLWAGFGGVAPALGPPLGGLLSQYDWRLVFLVNIPLALAAFVLTLRFVPESRDPQAARSLDWGGAVLGFLALSALTYALIQAGGAREGADSGPLPWIAAAVAVIAGIAFVVHQRRARDPMVPPSLFADRTFTATNLLTLGVYAAVGSIFFFLQLQLQTTLGYPPLLAGFTGLPSMAIMLLFSSRAGGLTTRSGPRLPLTIGPLIAAGGATWLAFLSEGDSYLLGVLPGIVLFGIGLTLVVAPLTTAVLAAAPDHLAGTASGVNNAVSRAAGLIAVAALPTLVGLGSQDYTDPAALTRGYQPAMLITAGLLLLGGACAQVIPRSLGADARG